MPVGSGSPDGTLVFFGRIHPDKGTAEAIEVARLADRPLVLAGIVLGAWVDDFTRVGWFALSIVTVLAVLAWVMEYVAALLGAKRAGDYAMLDAAGETRGFDVARMNSYEVSNTRVSSSAVREALAQGDMARVTALLGRAYSISGHVVHGRKLGRDLGFRTLNLRFSHWNPAASGIFAVHVSGLTDKPLMGVANLGIRPSIDANDVNGGRVLLETYCLDWPAALGAEGGYGKIVRVELLHKLHDELKYHGLDALKEGIRKDCGDARAFFNGMHSETTRQTTRDRI